VSVAEMAPVASSQAKFAVVSQDLQDWVRHPDSRSSRLYAALADVVAANSTASVPPEAT